VREYLSEHCPIQGFAGFESCRNAVIENDPILEEILSAVEKIGLSFNNSKVSGSKTHSHRLFSATASFYPNACSRPQIADFEIYNDLFYSELRFRYMILRYPEKLPLSIREMFSAALNGESRIKSGTPEQQQSITRSEGEYR